MKRILISGANGFVGSSLANELSKDFNVTGLVRKNANLQFIPENIKVEVVDYSNQKRLEEIFSENDIFIHCAAATKSRTWEEMKRNNVELTEKLLTIANRTKSLKQFIFISSQAACGPAKDKPITEDSPCNPISWYGKSKLLAEEIIKKTAQMPYTIIRPSSVYGPKDKDFYQYFKLMKFRLAFKIGQKPVTIAMIYVMELIKLIKLTILNPKAYNQIFLAAEDNYSVSKFISAIEKAMNIKAIRINVPEIIPETIASFTKIISDIKKKPMLLNKEKVKEMKIKNWTVSNKKAVEVLNYEPDNNLEKHIYETYLWYKENKWL